MGVRENLEAAGVTEFYPVYGSVLLNDIADAMDAVALSSDPLADLYDSITASHRSTHVTLIGDSITWGMTASDNSPTSPRNHALDDVRDNIASGSWANKLREWCAFVACGGRNESEPAPGESLYSHTAPVAIATSPIFAVSDGSAKSAVTGVNGPLLKSYSDLSVGKTLTFTFTGEAFTLYHACRNAGEAFTVYVDGVSEGSFADSGAVAWGLTVGVSGLDFGEHVVTITSTGSSYARLEAVVFTKTCRVTNNGLIGTDSSEWLGTGPLLPSGLPGTTTHVLIQLGTNDRNQAATSVLPAQEAFTSINLRKIVAWIRSNRPATQITLMAPPHAVGTSDEQGDGAQYHFSTDDLLREIRAVAEELSVGFVDNYTPTRLGEIDGTDLLADDLHPNDAGHVVIARNIIGAITRA